MVEKQRNGMVISDQRARIADFKADEIAQIENTGGRFRTPSAGSTKGKRLENDSYD